jgi:hypothetical protein
VSSRTARATQRNPVSKNHTKKKKKKKKERKKERKKELALFSNGGHYPDPSTMDLITIFLRMNNHDFFFNHVKPMFRFGIDQTHQT